MRPVELEVIGCVNSALLGFAQRFGARCAQRDDQDLRPVLLNLIEQIATFLRAEIHDEQRGIALLQDGIETTRIRHVTRLRDRAQERFHPPHEIGILRV